MEVKNFNFLGGRLGSSEKDIRHRKVLAWPACHKLRAIWSSSLKKRSRFDLSFVRSSQSYFLKHMDVNKTNGEKPEW